MGSLLPVFDLSVLVTESSGSPRSRTFWIRPCRAAWSATGPRMSVLPSSAAVISMLSNQADQRSARRPWTRIS